MYFLLFRMDRVHFVSNYSIQREPLIIIIHLSNLMVPSNLTTRDICVNLATSTIVWMLINQNNGHQDTKKLRLKEF